MKGLLHLTLCAISATTVLGKVTLEHVATKSTVYVAADMNLLPCVDFLHETVVEIWMDFH